MSEIPFFNDKKTKELLYQAHMNKCCGDDNNEKPLEEIKLDIEQCHSTFKEIYDLKKKLHDEIIGSDDNGR